MNTDHVAGDPHKLHAPSVWLSAAKLLSLANHATSYGLGLCHACILEPYQTELISVLWALVYSSAFACAVPCALNLECSCCPQLLVRMDPMSKGM